MDFAADLKRTSGLTNAQIERRLGVGGKLQDGSTFGRYLAGTRTVSEGRFIQLVKQVARASLPGKQSFKKLYSLRGIAVYNAARDAAREARDETQLRRSLLSGVRRRVTILKTVEATLLRVNQKIDLLEGMVSHDLDRTAAGTPLEVEMKRVKQNIERVAERTLALCQRLD